MKNKSKSACLMTTEDLDAKLALLGDAGCSVSLKMRDGTCAVKDGETVVLMSIQKGHEQPWVVRFFESDRIKWKEGP